MESSPQVIIRPAIKVIPPVEFIQAKITTPRRLVLALDGESKTGKTHFCLSAPGSIAYHDLDLGLEGVLEDILREFPDKEVFPFYYDAPISAALPGSQFTAIAEEARKCWELFIRNYRASLQQKRSCIVDTGSEAWALCRLARLGKLVQVLPIQYTAVNAEFRQLTQLALTNLECNVIYTHKMKAVYKNEQKTEEKERAGFGEIDYDVQAVLRTYRDTTKTGVEQFSIVIEECRPRMEATGTRLVGRDCTFQAVAKAIYPESDPEIWK